MNCASAFAARAISLPQAKSHYPKFDDRTVTVADLYEIFTLLNKHWRIYHCLQASATKRRWLDSNRFIGLRVAPKVAATN